MKKLLFVLFFLLTGTILVYGQNTVTLTTYYPAPYGSYDRLRLFPRTEIAGASCDIGTMYMNKGVAGQGDMLMLCQEDSNPDDTIGAWGLLPGVWSRVGNNIFPTNLLSGGTDDRFVRVGIGTTTPALKLHLENEARFGSNGDAGIFSWTEGTCGGGSDKCGSLLPVDIQSDGTDRYDHGYKFIWYPRKGSLRAGFTYGNEWSDAKIGHESVAFGISTVADGYNASAFGYMAQAHGNSSIAMGYDAAAGGLDSTGLPDGTGNHSLAIINGKTIGSGSVAIGIFGPDPTPATHIGEAQSNSFGSFVFGKWNVLSSDVQTNRTSWVLTDPLFVIGNGIDVDHRHNAFTILKNGQTGIGASDPRQLLDIEATVPAATTTPFVQLTNSPSADANTTGRPAITWFANYPTATDFTTARLSAEGGGNSAAPAPKFFIQVADSSRVLRDRLTIDRNGFIGIGTNISPRRLVDIQAWVADATITPILQLTNTHSTALTGRTSLDWWSDNSTADFTMARLSTEPGTSYQNTKFYLSVADATRVLRDRLVIDKNGNVGIGTTSPTKALEVSDVIKITPRVVGSPATPTPPPCAAASDEGSLYFNAVDHNFYGCRYDSVLGYNWAQLN